MRPDQKPKNPRTEYAYKPKAEEPKTEPSLTEEPYQMCISALMDQATLAVLDRGRNGLRVPAKAGIGLGWGVGAFGLGPWFLVRLVAAGGGTRDTGVLLVIARFFTLRLTMNSTTLL